MKITAVIPSRRWINVKTGHTASVFGAVPYTSEADKANWNMETVGWTWQNADGTVGLGRAPAATKAEAEEVMNKINNLK